MNSKLLLIGLICFLSTINAYAQNFYTGVDLSYVNELEDCGASYKDKNGKPGDPYEILSSAGSELVRLRLWHNPDWTNYSNIKDIKSSITRAKSAGMKVMLIFHYSDFWADPGRQWRPAAWESITEDKVLGDSVYNYTLRIVDDLNRSGLLPEFIQIGNETNGNILQPRNNTDLDGNSPDVYPVKWTRQVALLQRGIDAVNDFNQELNKKIQTIIHIADPKEAMNWFSNALTNGLANFDIIGLSYYPQWHEMGVREVGEQIGSLKEQFDKEVMVVETGYPWTNNNENDYANNILGLDCRLFTYGGSFSIETQRDFLIELSWLVKENGGIGVIYWEPAWISTTCQTYWATGSHWENATLFNFEGELHAGADFLSYDLNIMPAALGDQSVIFKVDMETTRTPDGVFVTGDFTRDFIGGNWSFKKMDLTKDKLYAFETTLPGRSQGAYIFYNKDEWLDDFREIVPASCANVWNTHREYIVKDESMIYHFSWGKCEK
ncbi:MAG: glycosyl hydrolase 53 family protein [Bacteroidota bacterium]